MQFPTYQNLPPLLSRQSIHKVILPSGRWPNSGKFTKTRRQSKVADHTEYEAVQERNWATGWENETDRSGEGDPCAVPRSQRRLKARKVMLYFKMANVMATIVSRDRRGFKWTS